jgi:hypothetical protein
MEAVAHCNDAHAKAPCALDRKADRLIAGQMAKRMTGIQNHGSGAVGYDFDGFLSGDGAAADTLEIHVDQHHAVRRDALKVRIDQAARHGRCRFAR